MSGLERPAMLRMFRPGPVRVRREPVADIVERSMIYRLNDQMSSKRSTSVYRVEDKAWPLVNPVQGRKSRDQANRIYAGNDRGARQDK